MKSVLFIRRLFQIEFRKQETEFKSTVRALHQPVDARKYEARAGKRGISPLAERAALRALKEGARAPKEGAYGVTTTY